LLACSSLEAELQSEAEKSKFWNLAILQAEAKSLETYDERKAQRLFARFVKNHTWQTPTIATLRGYALFDESRSAYDLRLRDLAIWMDVAGQYGENDLATLRKVYLKKLELIGAMSRAGVGLLAGTDMPFWSVPGLGLHDELRLMVKAGLTPMAALQTATLNPAKYLGLQNALGTIEKGKIADLVLLDADPLKDISNTERVNAVVLGGALIPQSQLKEMLAKVKAKARER
jgi:imidazolonepropionase-like amidohydrolase